jgi:NTE family protein
MQIGLALSGGAVRGIAHLGVLSSLIKAGIPIDLVAGCSAGAVLAALFCYRTPIEDIHALIPHLSWRRLARPIRSNKGLLTMDRLERWLMMLIGDLAFSDLKIPLAIVAMDVETGERVILQDGRLARAVRASCSVPGIITPVEINGRFLADGGIVDNLPVDAARHIGADIVIGVDIFEPYYGRESGLLGSGLTTFETLIRNAGGGVNLADFLIKPCLAGQTFVRFSQCKMLIALGDVAAEASLPSLFKAMNEVGFTG